MAYGTMTLSGMQSICDSNGLDYRQYSGRGMYGAQCFAIEGDNVMEVLSWLIAGCDDTEQAALLVRDAKTDSMGHGTVVYWPNIPYEVTQEGEDA